jgi:hypothetical protein
MFNKIELRSLECFACKFANAVVGTYTLMLNGKEPGRKRITRQDCSHCLYSYCAHTAS